MSFEQLSGRYAGDNATDYERRRVGKKWFSENRVVNELLKDVGERSRTLDVPVGTGRFFAAFKSRNFEAYGADASPDMIAQARANARQVGIQVAFQLADILSLPFADGVFDLVLCIRFLNLIDWQGVSLVLHELTRVSRDKVMIGVRYYAPFSELRLRAVDLVRFWMRLFRVPRYLSRWRGIVVHDKRSLTALFEELGVSVRRSEYVQRRWDGTDYVILVLQKSAPKNARESAQPSRAGKARGDLLINAVRPAGL